jgi:hypothetical protein
MSIVSVGEARKLASHPERSESVARLPGVDRKFGGGPNSTKI